MKDAFLKLTQSLIFTLTIVAIAGLALFFLPTTTEFFEYNKFTLLLVLTIAGFVIWAGKMFIEKRTVLTRTPLDLPIIILLGVYLVASYASIDQFISIFGNHGRIWPGFIPLLVLASLYFLISSNLKTRRHVNLAIWATIIATTLAAAVAIISYFGIFLPFDFAQIRSFNTLGIVNRLALLEAVVLPLSISIAIYDKDKTARAVASVATILLAFSFVLVNFLPAYIGLIFSIIFLGLGTLKVKLTKSQQGHALILGLVLALFLVIRFVPQVANGTLYQWIGKKDGGLTEQQQIDTPKEKTISQQASWDIAAQAIGKRPIFGTGPGTYQFVYTQLKPREINGTDDWAVRFDKSASEFTEIIATVGIVGIIAYLLVIVSLLRFVWALIFKSQHTIVYLSIAASLIGYLISNLFITSSFATFGIFIILAALLSVLAKSMNEDHVFDITVEIAALKNRLPWIPFGMPGEEPLIKTEQTAKGAKSQVLPLIFAAMVIVLSALALNYQVKAYQADYYFRQAALATRSNDGNKVIQFTQKALAANPKIDTYHRSLSETTLRIAVNLSTQKNLSDEQKQLLGQLASVAIDQAKAASGYQILPLKLPGISAANVANWETLSNAYQALIGAVQGADVHATNTLAQAIALDPQNPILHNRLGALYQRLQNQDLAQRKFEDAIIVKGDYGPAHYSLASILIERKGDVARIVNELSLAKRLLPKEDPALPDIDKKLDEYNKQLRELQEKAQSEQQNQTSASPKPSTSPSPSPSTSPSPKPSASPTPTPTPTPSPSL